MTLLKELRQKAKEQGLKGYSTLSKDNLQCWLAGKPIIKTLKSNQVSVGTQTDFPICLGCMTKKCVSHMLFKDDAKKRKISCLDGLEIDTETGEVLACEVDYARY